MLMAATAAMMIYLVSSDKNFFSTLKNRVRVKEHTRTEKYLAQYTTYTRTQWIFFLMIVERTIDSSLSILLSFLSALTKSSCHVLNGQCSLHDRLTRQRSSVNRR